MADRYLHRTPAQPGRFPSPRLGRRGGSVPDTRFSAVFLDATGIPTVAELGDAHVCANSLPGA